MSLRYAGALLFFLVGTFAHASQPIWNPAAAAKYLDDRAKWWSEWTNAARGQGTACVSCHTTFPYLLARPALSAALGETEQGMLEKQWFDNVKKRVANWDKIVGDGGKDKDPFRPFYGNQRKPTALGTEAVLNALVLVNHDARRAKGVLSESTKKALGHLWATQQADGTWQWLDFGLRPWETDGVFLGASLAALAVGMAGKDYRDQEDVAPKVARLAKYLGVQSPNQRLHDRMFALWATSNLRSIMSDPEVDATITAIKNAQEDDGGWQLAKLGHAPMKKAGWTSQGNTEKSAKSDGYATALAVIALRNVGVAPEDANLKKGIAWLKSNQKNGTWPATYLNSKRDPDSDVGKFMRDAATAFAVLALADEK